MYNFIERSEKMNLNTQDYIITEMRKYLEKMLILSSWRLKNAIAIIIGIIAAKSVLASDIAEKLKDCYSVGTEPSKIKRIYRFFNNSKINAETVYYFFIKAFLEKYKNYTEKISIIFDHTTIDNRFLILQFSLKVDKRAIPLIFRIFEYDDKNNRKFKHIKEGLEDLQSLFSPYDFSVTLLADRGFQDLKLFRFVEKTLKWKYCIRCKKDTTIKIKGKPNIKKLEDINIKKGGKKKGFRNVLLTRENYKCNLGVAWDEEGDEVWYIATNMSPKRAIREYATRFRIEEMFRDMKSNGFNMEETWTEELLYFKNLYLCICIAYTFIVTLGKWCTKCKKNKIIGATKKVKGKTNRVYSLFKSGLKWFNKCYYSSREKYFLKLDFVLYER